MTPDTKPCPICGEIVQRSAKKCIHCGEFLELDESRFSWLGIKGKTAWDVLSLIGIPLALAFVGFYLANLQDQRQERIEESRIVAQSTVEANRVNANSLQSYLDDMSELVLKENLGDEKTLSVARARTISVLSELDGVRNGRVINFLLDAGLMNMIWSAGAQLREVNLRDAYLYEADLSGANLRGADLSEVNLRAADLSGANLSGADLRHASLGGADLSGATLRWADLRWVHFGNGDLVEADLIGADLRWANLRAADLSGASLGRAKYNKETQWPENFDLRAARAILVDDEVNPIEDSDEEE